jgi:Leucine-rich repeat (LRR) protein
MNLQKLDLRENKITSIPKEIEDLTRLNVCLFGHNRLNFIPGHFFKLFRMEIFDVSNNLFSPKAPVESGNMELLKDLKEWDISVGRLSKLSVCSAIDLELTIALY